MYDFSWPDHDFVFEVVVLDLPAHDMRRDIGFFFCALMTRLVFEPHFIGEEGIFNRAKGIHEHFIDLQNVINAFKKLGATPIELVNAKRIGFQLIHDGVPQREIRKLKDILSNEKTKNGLWQAVEYSKPETVGKKREEKIKADLLDEFTPARTIFNNCIDETKALSEALQPEKLLRRALTNLESIELNPKTLGSLEVKTLIKQIEKAIEKIKS